jgi:hypothetical protein
MIRVRFEVGPLSKAILARDDKLGLTELGLAAIEHDFRTVAAKTFRRAKVVRA